jgi:hypothetical protein
MESGSEDGEIVGEVNENYDKGYVQPALTKVALGHNSSSRAASLSLLQQLVPGWGDADDELVHPSSVKRKPKKEKKSKRDKRAKQQPAADANGTPAAEHPDYTAFYGSDVSSTTGQLCSGSVVTSVSCQRFCQPSN